MELLSVSGSVKGGIYMSMYCEILENLRTAQINIYKPDLKKLPTNWLSLDEWNTLMRYLNERAEEGTITKGFPFTPSGSISIADKKACRNCYAVKYKYSSDIIIQYATLYILTYYIDEDNVFHALNCKCFLDPYKDVSDSFASVDCGGNPKKLSGREAFARFCRQLRKDGIQIDDYKINNGAEVKKLIPKPYIKLSQAKPDEIYENVHHLDIHSSYPSAMAEYYPEWRPAIQRMYDKRKQEPEYKQVLNLAYGFFQSCYCKSKDEDPKTGYKYSYALAHVSRFCIQRNNEKLMDKTEELVSKGCKILAFNTDGVWFQGPSQDELIGETRLGYFQQDHTNCKIRFKSAGSYEYIENGLYCPVVRGSTVLDKLMPREKWQWGDIYNDIANPEVFTTTDEYGIIDYVPLKNL